MPKLSLYIADVSEEFILNVLASVGRTPSIRVVGFARDGLTALEQIQALHPNVLLTDVQLPGLDGLDLMRRTRQLRQPPLCIACTRFYADIALDAALQCGAAYFVFKPISFERLPGIITSCWEIRRSASKKAPASGRADQINIGRIRDMLNDMGFPFRRSGSLFVIESILRLNMDPGLLRNLSKGLYAELASTFDTTPACIERSLRSAIAYAYEHGGLSEIFPQRPSNRAFIQYILNAFDMETEPTADFERAVR